MKGYFCNLQIKSGGILGRRNDVEKVQSRSVRCRGPTALQFDFNRVDAENIGRYGYDTEEMGAGEVTLVRKI